MRARVLLWAAALAGLTLTAVSGKEAEPVQQEIDAWVAGLPSQWTADRAVPAGSMVYRLSGAEGGAWHVTIDSSGKLSSGRGETESPTATIECSAEDFAAILRGQLDAAGAYFSGKVRISGSLDFVAAVQARLPMPGSHQAGEGAGPATTDTSGWYQFDPSPTDYGAPAASDASDLLDPPAGKHGFVTVKGEEFAFEDGTPARFWGTNIVAGNVFMDHGKAERTAGRLARFGCNMVRLHHMDASWARPNIFDDSYDDTQHFSEESLDRLDYLIHQLKQRGIYIYLDLLVHRKFKRGDEVRDWERVDNGAKIVAHFNRRMVELQKKYAHELYTHVNKYTGLRYCDDPAIAMSEVINESSLFWAGGYGGVPPSYLAELDDLYQRWARERKAAVPQGASVRAGLEDGDPQVLEFLYETQVAYFTEMRDYLRSIGVKVPIAGSNHWEMVPLDLRSNLELDFLDRHGYWDHPQGGYGPGARFDNRPMVKSRRWNLPVWFAANRAAGKPLIITEWNCCWINEYIAEAPLILAAYGAYQKWNGLLQFDYSGSDWADRMDGNFDIGNKPHVFATWPAAARIFLKGGVEPGGLLESKLSAGPVSGRGRTMGNLPDRAGLRRRIAFSFAAAGESPARPELPPLEGAAVSDTGQLRWDSESGLVTVDSPAAAARIGFAIGPVEVGAVTFEVSPEFAVVSATALDDRPIRESAGLLITATARAENSGMVYGPGRTTARDAGHPPILMEPVRGQVRIAFEEAPKLAAAYALDAAGGRKGAVEVAVEGSQVTVALTADAFWYEVEVKR